MEPETRPASLGLMQALQETPHAFSFFQVVRLLQVYAGGARIGHQGPASEEPVRLHPAVSLAFPAADVQSLAAESRPDAPGRRFHVSTSFMGLFSSDSPLPTYYVEDLLWKETDQHAVREFLDIFHHRALSLLYRTWEKYRYQIQFQHGGADPFSHRIFSLIGLSTPLLRDCSGLPAVRLIRYAGLITQQPHSAASIAAILKDYLALPRVKIEQCVERWAPIDPAQQNRLGLKNCTLGRDCVIGSQVRDRRSKFRASLGPLDLRTFRRFLPTSREYAELINLTRFLATDRLDFDVELKLAAAEAPSAKLSSTEPERLGWTTWMRPDPGTEHSVRLRQPREQSPQNIFPWPESSPAAPGAADEVYRPVLRSA